MCGRRELARLADSSSLRNGVGMAVIVNYKTREFSEPNSLQSCKFNYIAICLLACIAAQLHHFSLHS